MFLLWQRPKPDRLVAARRHTAAVAQVRLVHQVVKDMVGKGVLVLAGVGTDAPAVGGFR